MTAVLVDTVAHQPALMSPPAPPVPAQDAAADDLFTLSPADALALLSDGVELLVRMTGDVPPTPPAKIPSNTHMTDMQAEKLQIVRSHSQTNLAQMTEDQPRAYNAAMSANLSAQTTHGDAEPVDGVRLRHHHEAQAPAPAPYIIVGEDSQPLNTQHAAITRKFYSKKEPPIAIGLYLRRIHQFCPMSTAVYLATSLYIHRLAVVERAIPVTRLNAHRLVLAGLRVAMKALEDLSYPHAKIAKVGGISEVELARLEISFCFLTGFELVVGADPLRRHWEELRDGKAQKALKGLEVPTLTLGSKARRKLAGDGQQA